MLLNSPAKVASNWYGGESRYTATTVAIASQPFGVALGVTLPSFFVHKEDMKN